MIEERAEILKSIAHPTRITIIETLRAGEKCVCDIIEEIGMEQSNTSQHLSILKKSGILNCRKEGARVMYWVCHPEIHDMMKILDGILLSNAEKKSKLLQRVRK